MEYEESKAVGEFDDEFKARLLDILEKSSKGMVCSESDAAVLFHWVRHQDDPAYAFVPKRYRSRR